jgi:hypothetical protein
MSADKATELDDFLKKMFVDEPAPISTNIESSPAIIAREPVQEDHSAAVQGDAVNDPRAAPDHQSPTPGGEQAKALLAGLELKTAIRLRWVMRDIRSRRRSRLSVSENDMAALIEMGLVEMREHSPCLTSAGILALEEER